MKFRMFTDFITGKKVAANIDHIVKIEVFKDGNRKVGTALSFDSLELDWTWEGGFLRGNVSQFRAFKVIVREDFDTVFSRLNTIAE